MEMKLGVSFQGTELISIFEVCACLPGEVASLPPWAQWHIKVEVSSRTPQKTERSSCSTLIHRQITDSQFSSRDITSKKMHSCTLIFVTVGIFALVASSHSAVIAIPPPQCTPSIRMNIDTKYRKICDALSQLANALESDERELLDPLIDSGMKRTDVDHVFLRFGRRM